MSDVIKKGHKKTDASIYEGGDIGGSMDGTGATGREVEVELGRMKSAWSRGGTAERVT